MPPTSLIFAWTYAVTLTWAVLAAAWNQPSLEKGMAFYGSYHQNGWNQFIHFFSVPCNLFSALLFGCHLKTPIRLPAVGFCPAHQFSIGTFWTFFYMFYYLNIDPIGGTLFAPVLLTMYYLGVKWVLQDQKLASKQYQSVTWTGTGAVLKWSLWVQLFSWYFQIHPGHAVFEGAKPALLDSLGDAFSTAPLFAFYEGIWFLGLRSALKEQVQVLVEQHTRELCQRTGTAMRVCETFQ